MLEFLKKIVKQAIINIVSMIISMVVLFFVISLALGFFDSSAKQKISDSSILKLDLQGEIVEKPLSFFAELLSKKRDSDSKTCIWDILSTINHAKSDARIKAVYIIVDHLKAGWAQVEEIRHALEEFKKSGKEIHIYSSAYTHKTYFLATLADKIYLHPEGDFQLQGLSVVSTFYKPLLDKLEVQPQVFRVGSYKSAVEPFIGTQLSKESREQLDSLLQDIYKKFLTSVSDYLSASNNKKTIQDINAWAEALAIETPVKAVEEKLVTKLQYKDDVENAMKEQFGPDAKFVSFTEYKSQVKSSKRDKKIAVLVAEGEINTGHSANGLVGAASFAKLIKKIKEDDSIKAVVLRINSPGGSALASDDIWKELKELQKKKPIVASMSNIAASGGYYIATACNKIIAHHTTITGSIGVFGIVFDAHLLLKNKIGIVTDVVKTNAHADMFYNMGRSFNEYEKNIIQQHVERTYRTFVQRVVDGRKMPTKEVEKVAQGRVWSGHMALVHKLVDDLGGIDKAITTAAQLAGLGDYEVVYKPQQSFGNWEESVYDAKCALSLIQNFTASRERLLEDLTLQRLASLQGVQARLPYGIEIF